MAQLLGQVNPGTIVKLNENGQPVEFYVAAQDYESGLNGQGRVLIVRKDVYNQQQWNSSELNIYENSLIDTWFNNTYKNLLDSSIQSNIGTTKFPYTPGNENNIVSTLTRSIFALSATELGQSQSWFNVEGTTLPITYNLKIVYMNGNTTTQWTRSPSTNNINNAIYLDVSGNVANMRCINTNGARPAFTLPSTLIVESDGTITNPPTLSIYVPSQAMQSQSLPIQWSPISNATSYQLQRNTGSTWETIYTGTDTSYTDTVGSWTTVQYQVAASFSGSYGAYTQSASIPVIPASTLAISGQDGSLGTITADIPYTVTSDTGNPISIVRTVNGVQYGARTVESGFAYNIPVMELPTGDGTIVITASVQSSSELVTVTRTWTYNKTPINFSNSGSVASLAINGQNILPTTLAEAVRTSPVWGGSLDLALQKLSSAAFYETVAPTAQLGSLAEGSIIYLNENGKPVEFYVAKQGYEPSYNTDRVLVVRKEAIQQGAWNSSGVNTYDGSTIDTWFNSTYLQTLDSDVQTAVGTTNIPYTPMGGTTTVQRINKAVFALSLTEFGINYSDTNEEGSSLPIASTLQQYCQNLNANVWTRTPYKIASQIALTVRSVNNATTVLVSNEAYYLPAFTLPSIFFATLGPSTTGLYDLQNNLLLSLPGVNIETGSYVGTGTYGSSNPNSLTFGFEPKVFWIYGASTSGRGVSSISDQPSSIAYIPNIPSSLTLFYGVTSIEGEKGNAYGAYENKTYTWYHKTNADDQLNSSGETYYYIIIG